MLDKRYKVPGIEISKRTLEKLSRMAGRH